MALGIYFSPKSMSTQQYDTCIKKLEAAGAGKPAGRLYHASFLNGGKVAVFDVWDSQQSFDRFGQTLMPIMKDEAKKIYQKEKDALPASKKAAVDTRAHGLAVEKEALQVLADKGITILECDKEAFRKRVLPQTENFVKARPDAKPVVDIIHGTEA